MLPTNTPNIFLNVLFNAINKGYEITFVAEPHNQMAKVIFLGRVGNEKFGMSRVFTERELHGNRDPAGFVTDELDYCLEKMEQQKNESESNPAGNAG